MQRCPGSDMRNITADEVLCQACGRKVELFSDEQRRRCPHCGSRVSRDAVPSCAAWCSAAEACLGPERLAKFQESIELALAEDADEGAE